MNGLTLYVDDGAGPDGDGTRGRPFGSFGQAQEAARHALAGDTSHVDVMIAAGTYYLDAPLSFTEDDGPDDSRSVCYRAATPGTVTIAGGMRLECRWEPFRDGIYRARVPEGLDFDQLFVNGRRQIRARYPNYDPSNPAEYSGYTLPAGKIRDDETSPDPMQDEDMTFSSGAPRGIVYDPGRFTGKRWERPDEAIIHIYQAHYWGNLQWEVRRIDWDTHRIWFGHGGHQMGAKWCHDPCEVNERSHFYIENVFEELDTPGEWYLDRENAALFYYPLHDIDLSTATIEVPRIETLLHFTGSQRRPIRNVRFEGFRFALTVTTFLSEYDIPSLSDWAIHRGGTVLMEGTRDCEIRNCFFDAVGGNGVFLNRYNRGAVVRDSLFAGLGDSAVCFVGSLNTTVGTQRSFPYGCTVSNNVIHDCGRFGKQVAGVYISRAKRITVRHNEIYDMPRAGICIGDGTWGGHLIEHNFIHDTCRETGDHGPFNAWGRDKYWCLVQSHTEYLKERNHDAGHVLVDAMEPVVMRYNYFRERSGWGIDLDDGASNYEIYKNLCVGVSIKLREGAHRTIYNNIWVNGANSPCFHVGNEHNRDRYYRNITVMSKSLLKTEDDFNFQMGAGGGEVYTLIAPPSRSPWLEECDRNCFYSDIGEFKARAHHRRNSSDDPGERKTYDLEAWREMGYDLHSVFADPLFIDPGNGDYRVQPESPALDLGFENFDMDDFGVTADYPDTFGQKR